MSETVAFAFAVHLHQPLGNFDEVFREHLVRVYRPFLERVDERECYPFTLHVSGPLLDWLSEHEAGFVDWLARRVAEGRIELLGSGRHEPVLAALARHDRVEQVLWMQDLLRERFGFQPRGLWLTERVWETDLAADLSRAGIAYALLDDRHFLTTGLAREELDGPFHTEADGCGLALLPIDERLRYLIPFRPVEEIERFFEARRAEGTDLVVLGDDGEKFGGWPETRAWVYEGEWLDRFLDLLERLRAQGRVRLVTTGEGADLPSRGLVYPTPGSYREMEEWTLPRLAALRLEALREAVERAGEHGHAARLARAAAERSSPVASGAAARPGNGADDPADPGFPDEDGASPFIRGGGWKNFFVRYAESNRMHKTALQLSRLCRERGDPGEARRAIGRAQCNDAYWHGIFGGVYLPHLRQAVWRELARAEASLRRGERLAWDILDFDLDGRPEIWIHSDRFSALISPDRGAALEVLLRFDALRNDADVFSRYLEAYHGDPARGRGPPPAGATRGGPAPEATGADEADVAAAARIPSVHERHWERPLPPGVDRVARAVFQERWVLQEAGGAAGRVAHDWSAGAFRLDEPPALEAGRLRLTLVSLGDGPALTKRFLLAADGVISVELAWDGAAGPPDGAVQSELSLSREARVSTEPAATESRRPIVTLARSERGFEEIVQGESRTFRWAAAAGRALVRLDPPPP